MRKLVLLCFLLLLIIPAYSAASAEPVSCLKLVPLEDDQVNLVQWLLKNGEQLKKDGCWKSHVKLGGKALKEMTSKQQYLEQAQLKLQLASSYFYLGEYSQARKLVETAREYAQKHNHGRELVESLYLLSAIERVEGNRESIAWASKALTIAEQYLPQDRYLRAKVLYNLGAVYSESESPDLNKSRAALLEADTLYRQLNNAYEIVRTGLRLARVDYLKKDYQKALLETWVVEKYLETPRSRMLYHYQLGKILHRMKQWGRARSEAQQALSFSRSLEAKADQQKIEQLLEAIRFRSVDAD